MKNNIAQILNTNIEDFRIDIEKLSFIEEIISYLIKLDSEKIAPSQLNQILEKITFNFNQTHMQNLSEKLNNLINLLIFQESFENKEKFLIEDDRKWLEFIRFLNQVKSLRKIQTDVNTANQSLNHKNQILTDKETSQNNINISQMNNTQKLNENLSLRFKKFEKKNFNINNLVNSYSEEKYLNLNKIPDQLNKENLIFKNIINENIKNNDLVLKKGEVFDKKLSFYETFQNLVHNELIKNHLEIGNIPKLESAKVVNFQKIPGDILEIVKDMVLEIQPHGEKKALIKIEPPEMGFLDLEIKVKNKEVKIIAKIERIELLQEIKQNLHNIKTSLEESGLNLKDVQLLLSSGFDNGNMVKNFEKEERNYSEYKTKTERIEEIDNKDIKIEDLNKFYNRNGKYYYIV
ncbi:MAG: Flagellar hook-length control protein FliK [Thermodesulfobacteria bacterium]|nr:flagellar hook-length control protein FliK [Thermodesulfobacteriota bacterium]MCU4137697.1 Flagellar hook-length control protein FliK [Thermodesulfobacteriota bacterium]